MMSIRTLLASVIISMPATSTCAQFNGRLATHCASTEFVVLSSTMGHFVNGPTGRILRKNGKVLSICADKVVEPYDMVVYRYGKIGRIELEHLASPENKFGLSVRSLGPHSGEEIMQFKVGRLNYYVFSATGQGNGISLLVFDAGKKMVDLFSGSHSDSDFQSGPAYVNYEIPKSPVFRLQNVSDIF